MPTIALLGTGLLGEAIGRRLLEQGVTLKVWNRSPDKYESLLQQGAVQIKNLAGAAKGCQAVITFHCDGYEIEPDDESLEVDITLESLADTAKRLEVAL